MPTIFLTQRLFIIFKIDITQTKGENNLCVYKGWWQNELVVEGSYSCKKHESGINLYVAGRYDGKVVDGQVRNFSYTKK